MKFTAIIAALSMAMAASAAPAEAQAQADAVHARNGGGGGTGSCTNNQVQVCCNAGLLACIVQVLGGACTGQAYCCSTNSAVGALIDITALNCVQV